MNSLYPGPLEVSNSASRFTQLCSAEPLSKKPLKRRELCCIQSHFNQEHGHNVHLINLRVILQANSTKTDNMVHTKRSLSNLVASLMTIASSVVPDFGRRSTNFCSAQVTVSFLKKKFIYSNCRAQEAMTESNKIHKTIDATMTDMYHHVFMIFTMVNISLCQFK